MRHFPIYLDTRHKKIVVSGAGACAVAKLRILLKCEADIHVFGETPHEDIQRLASEGRLHLHARRLRAEDTDGAALVYGANDDADLDSAAANFGRASGAIVNIVDNLDDSDFITPAIVDRDPVTVAIGTEGAAPVLARKIKADLEETLPRDLGILARIGMAFRPHVLRLPFGRPRRDFWARYFFDQGPKALEVGEWAVEHTLHSLLSEMEAGADATGHVHIIGAGPGDPDLLTQKARRLLHEADVVIHDRLVSPEILELARREAEIVEVGKIPFGPSWKQDDINALLVKHGRNHQVVRLKSGDSGIFGRLDEEMDALDHAGVEFSVVPGITAAAAAAAHAKVSLTKRGRNSSLRILSAHDTKGFAEQDWRSLARPGEVAAIYMGRAAARFLVGRLMIHGAEADTPVTVVENASRADQRRGGTTLAQLPETLDIMDPSGPVLLLLGVHPRDGAMIETTLKEAL